MRVRALPHLCPPWQLGVPAHLASRSIQWEDLTNVAVTKQTAAGNYAEARRHQHDCKLLDANGELFSLDTPLEAAQAAGLQAALRAVTKFKGSKDVVELKPLLGPALTAYLKGTVSLVWALWRAALFSIASALACRSGGVLTQSS